MSKINERVIERTDTIVNLLNIAPEVIINSYLDLGCGSAEITSAVAEALKIEKSYCADIISNPKNYSNLIYLQIEEKENKIDIPDKTVDLITCLVSIHHFRNLEMVISEIDRISKPGEIILNEDYDKYELDKYESDYDSRLDNQFDSQSQPKSQNTTIIPGTFLIIREHDAIPSMQPYLDFIHLIELIKKDIFDFNNFYASYYQRTSLQNSLEIHGWKYITSVDYPKNIPNPQGLYTSLFMFTGVKIPFLVPMPQTTEYRLNNGKLLDYVSKLRRKDLYIKALKKIGIDMWLIHKLLNISDIDYFTDELIKNLK